MKKLILLIVVFTISLSCSSKKQVEKAINTGNYDKAIYEALDRLKTNKNKKRKEEYAVMLQDAFYKAEERDLNTIKHLKKDNNPELYSNIYDTYANLNNRQEAIKPILPLNINGKDVKFKFHDYSNDIIEVKSKTSDYLYNKASQLLTSKNKLDAREAFNDLNYIENINPNFKNIRDLIDEAHFLGTDFVLVTIINNTQQVIPQRLEDDLLNFDTYGLSDLWTEYHGQANSNIHYDYAMNLQLRDIIMTPERINERQVTREKEITDGWEYELDRNGNVKKDSLGNDIKVDKIITIKAQLTEVQQHKAVQILGQVTYTNLKTKQLLETFPIDSGFIFENWFARYNGDKRALTRDDLDLLNQHQVPFPSNEQMVYDSGEDLKQHLKRIINKQRF